jgi:FAD-dependent urate hydroxylase
MRKVRAIVSGIIDYEIAILGAGPYGLSAAAHLRAAGIAARVFGEPMTFWERQMPKGMCLRSSWAASHISDPGRQFTLDAFMRATGNHCPKPIPLPRFLAYGKWFQQQAVPDLDRRTIKVIEASDPGFKITLSDGDTLLSKRVVVAAGIHTFARRPSQFDRIPVSLASHSSEHDDLGKFKGKRVVVIGAGQSALESAALCREAGADAGVIARQNELNWVGLHPQFHRLGVLSKLMYSDRDVGPAGISRLVATPHLFRLFPHWFQDPVSYRAIRPAVAGWLKPRLNDLPITLGRHVVSALEEGGRLRIKLSDGTELLVDHVLLATGYRVDVSRYSFLSPDLVKRIKTVYGYPVLQRGFETSVPGLHIVGKPAAWSFGPILGFVSGTEFASPELARTLSRHGRKLG